MIIAAIFISNVNLSLIKMNKIYSLFEILNEKLKD